MIILISFYYWHQNVKKRVFTYRSIRHKKERRTFSGRNILFNIFIDTNGVSKSSTMVSDISKRKKTEAAMQLSNERFYLVVKATNDLVWDWDLVTGEIYRSGNNLADVYGHSSNESIRKIQLGRTTHPLDKDKIKASRSIIILIRRRN